MNRPDTLIGQLGRRLARRAGVAPKIAIVLGSGFKSLGESVDKTFSVPYSRLPGFAKPSVPGHEGTLICGQLAGVPIWVLSGRAHFYEGHSMDTITRPIRVLAAAGVTTLLLTNAAGGIRKGLSAGHFMRITDHINLMGTHPLRGSQHQPAPPFVDLTQAYDSALGDALDQAARTARVHWHQGVYLAVSGPSYETPSEIQAFKRLGADAVGMSTVPEVIVARQLSLRVAAVSCITNAAAGLGKTQVSHQEVLETGRRAGAEATRLITEFVGRVGLG